MRAYAGTHGIGHITRVLVWAAQIADRVHVPVRREELFRAAGLHDIKRWTDGGDREHGARAADWVLSDFTAVRPDVAAALDLELVASLCRHHVPHDHLVDPRHWCIELRILKDADGLERVRIYALDPTRLRLREVSPALERSAWRLMEQIGACGNDATAVRAVALEMGLWR
jgi:HD superfamily phosphodiesterase